MQAPPYAGNPYLKPLIQDCNTDVWDRVHNLKLENYELKRQVRRLRQLAFWLIVAGTVEWIALLMAKLV